MREIYETIINYLKFKHDKLKAIEARDYKTATLKNEKQKALSIRFHELINIEKGNKKGQNYKVFAKTNAHMKVQYDLILNDWVNSNLNIDISKLSPELSIKLINRKINLENLDI
jgi:hypothetical protein